MAFHQKEEQNRFIGFYCAVVVLYCLLLTFLYRQFNFNYSDEMLTAFIFPLLYAAHRFSRKVFLFVAATVVALSSLIIYFTTTNFTASYRSLFFIFSMTALTGEFIFRSQKKLERTRSALIESEGLYRSMFESADILVSAYDRQGKCILMNQVVAQFFGGTPDDFIGKTFHELHPSSAALYTKRIQDAITSGAVKRYDDRVAFPNGERRLLSSVFPERDMSGRIVAAKIVSQDVTEQIEIEKSLRESEDRFYIIIQNLPGGVFAHDFDGRIIFVNDSACKNTGFTRVELVEMKISDIDRTSVTRGDREKLWFNLRNGNRLKFETYYRRKDGSEFPVEVHLNAVTFQGKSIILSIAHDISERKRADKEREDRHRELKQILETLPDALVYTDNDRRITRVNNAFVRMFGYTVEEAIGRTTQFFYAHPDEYFEQGKIRFNPDARDVLKPYEIEYRRKNGETFVSESIGTPVRDSQDNVIGMFGLIRDISERKQIEKTLQEKSQLLNQIIDSVQEGVVVYDRDMRYTLWNPFMERMSGVPANEVLGKRSSELFPFLHEIGVIENVRRALDGEGPLTTDFIYPSLVTGETRWATDLSGPFRNADGEIVGAIATVRDITERRQAEEEKLKLEEQLRQSQKMEAIGTLAGGVAHDFNNILMAILGYSQIALSQLESTHPLYGKIKEIYNAGERASSLTQQLLAFSRKQIIQPIPIDLNQKIAETKKMLERLLGEDIEIRIRFDDDLGVIHADPSQIDQIVMNVSVNARDAMPKGGVFTIETSNAVLDESYCKQTLEILPGRYVAVTFSDTGVGMSKETQTKIFEPFFTTKGKAKGTGLGLSTVYGIVKQNNGHISVSSKEGEGSTFRLYFPQMNEPSPGRDVDAPTQQNHKGSEGILIVEDDAIVREYLISILSMQGYFVLSASDYDEALKAFHSETKRIDLLISDVVLPGKSGKEISEELNRLDPALKVVFMSGYTEEAIVNHQVVDEGITLLQKPFTSDVLLTTVRETLDA